MSDDSPRVEKAGFHAVGEIVTPDGPVLYMTCERSNGQMMKT